MDPVAYDSMSADEHKHWWFVGRRAVIAKLIELFAPLSEEARILDAGCGSGGNLSMLSGFGKVEAFEFDEQARAHATRKGITHVLPGHMPDGLSALSGRTYDVITLLDVLEHVDADSASLAALSHHLAPEGRILITVPAMPFLWSAHDVVHHHKRRYTKKTLRTAILRAGLTSVEIGYFNTYLFPLAMAQRIWEKLARPSVVSLAPPPRPINTFLANVFTSEKKLVGKICLPIGLSLYAVAKVGQK